MIRYLLLIITFLLPVSSLHAMTARLHDKLSPELFAGMKTEIQQGISAVKERVANKMTYFKAAKDKLERSVVQKGLHWLENSQVQEKDTWASNTFQFLNKNKPELLASMTDYYENRLRKPIDNHLSPKLIDESTQVAAHNWKKISPDVFQLLMEQSPQARTLFAEAVAKDISLLTDTSASSFMTKTENFLVPFLDPGLAQAAINDPLVKKVLREVKTHFSKVDSEALWYISAILCPTRVKGAVDLISEISLEKPNSALMTNVLMHLKYSGRKLNKNIGDKVIQYIGSNFQNMSNKDLDALGCVADSSKLATLTDLFINNIDKLNSSALESILKNTSYASRGKILDALRDRLAQKGPEDNDVHVKSMAPMGEPFFKESKAQLANQLKLKKLSKAYDEHSSLIKLYNSYALAWYRPSLPQKEIDRDSLNKKFPDRTLSQTEAHLSENSRSVQKKFGTIIAEPRIQRFIEKIYEQEKKEQQQDRITFVHGCKWELDKYQDLFTKLMEIKTGKSFDRYRFLRFEEEYPNTQEQRDIRNLLLSNGRSYSGPTNELRPKLLFMNHALFGNTNQEGSCTFDYWYRNHDMLDVNRAEMSMENIFKKSGFEKYYSYYKSDIDELEKLHKAAKNKGTLLLLSVDRVTASEYIYPALVGGARYRNQGNVNDVIKTLKDSPHVLGNISDSLEYCMILTNDYALNPEKAGKDVKVYPFSLAQDTSAYKKYSAKRDELLDKIQRDFTNPGTKEIDEVRDFLSDNQPFA